MQMELCKFVWISYADGAMQVCLDKSTSKSAQIICNMAALTSAKKALRKEIKDILKNISLEEKKEQSANVFKKVSLRKVNKSIISKSQRFIKEVMF